MNKHVRRVVTGHDSSGKAIIDTDGYVPVVHTTPIRPGFAVSEVWVTDGSPARLDQEGEPTERKRSIEPPKNGTVFRVAEFPPEKDFIHGVDAAQVQMSYNELGSPGAAVVMKDAPHPFMHRTKTIDYGIVISGEMHLVMDDSEVVLGPGDVVVQRGTNHAWSNRSDKPCIMAFVLVDAE